MKKALIVQAVVATALIGAPLGCALFTKSDSVVLRYFTPETVAVRPDSSGGELAIRSTAFDLRMGRVNAASYVKDRIAFRDKNFEIGYYENLRWTEKPEDYLRRALQRAFFEEQGVRQIISGPGPTLDVNMDAFEEVRSPQHAARIELTYILHDDQHVKKEETFTVERPIPSDAPKGPEGIAAAMAGAFDESVKRVVSRVMVAMSQSAPTASSAAVNEPSNGAP